MKSEVDLFVRGNFDNVLNFAMKDITKVFKCSSADMLIVAQTINLTATYLVILYERVLGYSFLLKSCPKSIVRDHKFLLMFQLYRHIVARQVNFL